jgi:hypothetical protein
LSQESSIDKHLYRNILKISFILFTILFSHALRTHDCADLECLQAFAGSISDSPTSQPAHKVSRLASIFVSVAAVYIDSKEQEARNECVKPQRLAL